MTDSAVRAQYETIIRFYLLVLVGIETCLWKKGIELLLSDTAVIIDVDLCR
jgi:hypothetical protein